MVLGLPAADLGGQQVAELRVGSQELATGDGPLVREVAEGAVAVERIRKLVEQGGAQGQVLRVELVDVQGGIVVAAQAVSTRGSTEVADTGHNPSGRITL